MKLWVRIFCAGLLITLSVGAVAVAQNTQDFTVASFEADNFVQISVAAMAVLLGWGVANVGIGLFRCREKNAVRRYFWQMNLAWGAIDALLAAFTLKALAANYEKFAANAAIQNQQTNIVGLNILLDIGYVAVGLAMIR